MADTSLGADGVVGLPSSMMIGKRATVCPAGRLLNVAIAPSNGQTFPAGQTIQFDLNLRRGQYYSPGMLSLKFTVAFWQGAAGNVTDVDLDNYATCFFDSLQTYVNSVNIESITQLNSMAGQILDLQLTTAQKAGLSVSFGTATDGSRQGFNIGALPAAAVDQANAVTATFVIPVPSAFGAWASSYIDGSDISNIRMNFGIVQSGEIPVVLAGGSFNFEIRQPELLVNIVELANPGIVDQFKAGPVHYHMRTIKTSSQSIPAGTAGSLTIPINVRGLSSAVAAITRFRYATTAGNTVAAGTAAYRSASACPNIAQINYQFGGQSYPQKPINIIGSSEVGMGHSFSRAVMAFGGWSNPLAGVASGLNQAYNTVAMATANKVPTTYINTAATTAVGTRDASFVYGESLEVFAHDNDGGILDGVSTESMPGFLQMNIASGGTGAFTVVADTFVMHDLVLVAQGGTVMLRQ